MDECTISSLDVDMENSEATQPLLTENKTAAVLPRPHVFNDYHSIYMRYGIPVVLIGTFTLLLASDIGVGASAHVEMSTSSGKIISSKTNLEISVFSSVKKLWENDAVSERRLWPYVKLAMTLYAWVTPFDYGCRRRQLESDPTVFMAKREKMLFWLDVMGKFAFVDSFVLIVLMVVFRATVSIMMVTTDVWVTPRWGMYGFILASIMSLFGTQTVLHLHRGVQIQVEKKGDNPTIHSWEGKQYLIAQSGYHPVVVLLALVASIALLIIGATVQTFKFKYSGMTKYETTHSLISIGLNIPETARDDGVMIHFLQAFYFILTMAVPLLSCCIYGLLFYVKLTPDLARRIFLLSETALAWSALDVYLLSTMFAVVQIPNFAKHLVDEYCKSCFTIEAEINPSFALTCAAALLNFFLGLLLVKRAQRLLYAVKSVGLCCNNHSSSLPNCHSVVV
eukprot:scaffold7775_cov61-Cyclotella_meneghiniana.AAC.19